MPACRILNTIVLGAGLLLLTGCQSVPAPEPPTVQNVVPETSPPTINPLLYTFGQPAAVEHIFNLTTEQSDQFLEAYHHQLVHLPEHLRLARYLERLTASYNYRERTLTASEAFDGTPGNCISLVVLTTALAKLVDLDMDYQRLTTNPIFDKQQGIILVSDHVRTRVYSPPEKRSVIQRAHAVIDYFPARGTRRAERIERDTLLAMYYSNRAAESLLEDQLAAATQLTELALLHSPNHPSALNLLAVLHRRIGDEVRAERYYAFALEHHPNELNLLNNYQVLLSDQGRHVEASQLNRRIAALDDANPYQLIAIAQRAVERGEYQDALDYYQQAQTIAPYLHDIYLQQAVVLEHMGHSRRASSKLSEGWAQAEHSATETHFKRRLSAVKADSRKAW